MSVPRLPVALLGLGGVGRSILSQLLSPPLSSRFSIVLIANSRLSLSLNPSTPITPINYLPVLESHGTPLDLPSVVSLLAQTPNAILIDSTGSTALPPMYPQILSMGIHIVTPSKIGTSGPQELYETIMRGPGLYYGESTVMAGLPVLSTLKDLVGTGDEIALVEGVLSGTLSYIFNAFSRVDGGGAKFSEILKEAKDKGYTVRHAFAPTSAPAHRRRSRIQEMTSPEPTSLANLPSCLVSYRRLRHCPKAPNRCPRRVSCLLPCRARRARRTSWTA